MSLYRLLRLALPGALVVLGCASAASTGDGGDAAPDQSSEGGNGGVCCTITAHPGCSPMGDFGGWAASADQCRNQAAFDGYPFLQTTDSHGCAVLAEDSRQQPCGRVQLPDSGAADAASTPDGG